MSVLALRADERVADVKFTKHTLKCWLAGWADHQRPAHLVSPTAERDRGPAQELAHSWGRLWYSLAGLG
jgi:hypothetical protein